ncbi:hypothetical protein NHQ30_008834 [Ciborinia camelliae]|nr:hypothetical protein NHQ30_008834 [Ciborinia camelliae]
MSSPTICEQRLQSEEDIDVEDTVVSPLVNGNLEATSAFTNIPNEIVTNIMDNLGPVSQICFSLTGSRFRQIFRDLSDSQRYLHGSCHSGLSEACYSARLSLPLNTQESTWGDYIWDTDKCCFKIMTIDDPWVVEWNPTLVDLLWSERFFWSGGALWCHGCCRILPPTSWDQCSFEKEFWDHVDNPSVWKLQPHKYIASVLAFALFRGLERLSTPHPGVSIQRVLRSDRATVYESQENDFDYTLCTKCRVKDIITDNDRRLAVWTGVEDPREFAGTVKPTDGVAMNRELTLMSSTTMVNFVRWEDVFRECGLFVKEYKREELPCPRGQTTTTSIPRIKFEW